MARDEKMDLLPRQLAQDLLNQARAGRPARAWFLKITLVRMYVCVCVRPRGHE